MDQSQRGHARTRSITSTGSNNDAHKSKHIKSKSHKDSIYSDEATTAFIRRTLCAHQFTDSLSKPLSDLLPPLTSSNQLDLQLYAIISVLVKDFVHAWYSKITPDHHFTDHLVYIIAHCTRALEQRIRAVDLEALVFDELPELIHAHVAAYRTAHSNSYTSTLVAHPRHVYHAINPHPALSPVPSDPASLASLDQADNEAVWRQLLIQAALAHLLPPEHLENPPLRVLVTEIFSELIIGRGVCGNVCEGWFLWDVIYKLLAIIRPPELPAQQLPTSANRLEKFGLLADDSEKATTIRTSMDTLSTTFWQIMQYAFLAFVTIRAFFTALSDAASLPPRTRSKRNPTHNELDDSATLHPHSTENNHKRPILAMSFWACCSHLLSLDLRMPWLTTLAAYMQWLLVCSPWKLGYTNSRLDRLLSHHIRNHLLNPDRLPAILLLIRTNMFPNNSMGPARVPPTAAEIVAIRARCAAAIVSAVPDVLLKQVFKEAGKKPMSSIEVQAQVEEMLDVFADGYLNKHLIVGIVDLVFARLVPEILHVHGDM